MVNIDLHRSNLVNILREIYSDPLLRNSLGFKGGTAAMLFYGLPRFSVDLDFDLFDLKKKEAVFKRLKEVLPRFGAIIEAVDKQYTLFFLLNYQKGERGLKIDISKRPLRHEYASKSYLGISMLVMKEADMIASKLAALLTRKKFAARDMFDVWYFLKENWQIDERVLEENTKMVLTEALEKAQEKVKAVQKIDLLAGLGDLLDNKQKAFVREKLKDELVFLLKLYLDNAKKR
jgi:predicted nucleotidyltransferase component of viral defense system